MSSSPLASFNPHGNHSFMDHTKGAMPIPPPPSKYGQGVPSTHSTYQQQKPQSLPSSQPPSPLSAPLPQYPPQISPSYSTSSASSSSSSVVSTPAPIFTSYKLDGGIPELKDILSSKTTTWSRK
ncbi:hypothetical protein BC826DRAFT_1060365 [Russula brevipes]|nr:hypothetical protein BC826DRAFT_1060365 [Russula brevipes]